MKIIHINSNLDVGGTEHMLRRLIYSNPKNLSNTVVVSLTSIGEIGEGLRKSGILVHTLNMKSLLDLPIVLWQLIRIIRKFRPNIIQSWLYHADFLVGIASFLVGSISIIWNIRSTTIPQGPLSFTYWLVRICALLSYIAPDKIICCAESTRKAHIKLGYSGNKMIVIPNGFDFTSLNADINLKIRARKDLGINNNEIVIGVIGRFDPLKDFKNFILAAKYTATQQNNLKFLMVGRNNDLFNAKLCGWIQDNGLQNNFILVGQQKDIPYFLSAMDIFCLCSAYEAFPNVLVDAMAMELPCVVTKAGDSEIILDDIKYTVPIKSPHALAEKLLIMCKLKIEDRQLLGKINSLKVREKYDIKKVREDYERVYLKEMK